MIRLLYEASEGVFALQSFEWNQLPEYAILSHTWGEEEVLFHEIYNVTSPGEHIRKKSGYKKLEFCAAKAKEQNLVYFWCDTCCIDKSSSAELTEAINSMFEWYKNAQVCYAYLADVPDTGGPSTLPFRSSRWFTRGWTLQELIAPSRVEFYSYFGHRIGERAELAEGLARITRIPVEALTGHKKFSDFYVAERIKWARSRVTKRREDGAYALFGLLDVAIGSNYGEGTGAFERLFDRLIKPAPVSRGVERRILSDDDQHEIWEALQEVQTFQARPMWDAPRTIPPNMGFFHVAVVSMTRDHVYEFIQGLGGCERFHLDEQNSGWRRGFRGRVIDFYCLIGFDEAHEGKEYFNVDRIAQQLHELYAQKIVLDRTIFILPQTEALMRQSTEKALRLLRKFWGEQAVENTILRVPSNPGRFGEWSAVEYIVGVDLVQEDSYVLKVPGAYISVDNDTSSSVDDLLSEVVRYRRPRVLQIQAQTIDQHQGFNTFDFEALRIRERTDTLQARHERELMQLRQNHEVVTQRLRQNEKRYKVALRDRDGEIARLTRQLKSSNVSAQQEYTRARISKHNTKGDLLVIIHGRLYDITKWVDEHPGGEEVLLDVGGQDATEAFEDVGHSEEARKVLDGLCIGNLKNEPQKPSLPTLSPPTQPITMGDLFLSQRLAERKDDRPRASGSADAGPKGVKPASSPLDLFFQKVS